MSVISMKQLLEAGVHFGHQTRRWNPKMAQYIFTERNGIYIIDLQKTVKKAEEAYKAMKEIAETGKPVLFVGTKKQAQEAIKEEAERCGMFYVNERWLGGMLTNHKTIQTRINKLRENHYKYYTENNWKDPSNYDICINSDAIGMENAVELICDVVKKSKDYAKI